MRSSPFLALAFGISLALSVGSVVAGEPEQPQSVGEILRFQHDLRTKLEKPSGEYSRFDQGEIGRMEKAQDNVFRILSGVTSLDQLSEQQKIDVSNSLDQVKAILLANEGNRMICYRERKMGTNILTKRCETYAEREAHARESERELRNMNHAQMKRGS